MSDLTYPRLPDFGIFAGMKEDDRDILASYGEFIPVHPENNLIVQGQPQSHLYIILSGQLEIWRTGAEEDILVAVLGEGQSIGEINIFDPGTASATVYARAFAQAWRIDRENLEFFLRDNPAGGNHLLVGLLITLSKRVRDLNHKLVGAMDQNSQNPQTPATT